MRIAKSAFGIAVLAGFLAAAADGAGNSSYPPAPVAQTEFLFDDYAPVPPEPGKAAAEQGAPSSAASAGPVADEAYGACQPCEPCGPRCPGEDPWRLIRCKPAGFNIYGWINGGIMMNPDDPLSDFNGPVTFADMDDFQMNQLYLVAEKTIDTGGCPCWDIGGRIDVMYGTDSRFNKAAGWEFSPDFTDDWNDPNHDYQISVPQAYGEIGYGDISLKLGKFYTPAGYEVVPAIGNFFYTHAYMQTYAEPFHHFGGMASWTASDNWTVLGGLVNGWDAVDRVDDDISYLSGVTYTADDDAFTVALVYLVGEDPNALGVNTDRSLYTVVVTIPLSEKWEYVFQHDHGWQKNVFGGQANNVDDVEWYGFSNYLYYAINNCWRAGARLEYFRDDDGVRVVGIDDDNPYDGGSAGNFWDLTLGLVWTPTANFTMRPEVRWDWYDGEGTLPFDDNTDSNQFLVGTDMIWQF
ncbi:MAG: outer membrane beta-barrel protein [Thermoguttaceae bacterium]|nr:outer membrane beta-barrel protein [Thermoguttaceae bacterium]